LEALTLSTEQSGNTWFGCLLDDQDRLVASAFGTSSKILLAHLTNYAKSIGGEAVQAEARLTHEMIRLYDGDNLSKRVTFDTDHVSKYQRQVYLVLERIPKGRVTTYGLISKHLGSAPRAVGRAVASNPWPLFIPCERVVNFDLTIGNYGLCGSLGPAGTITKRNLLERENVPMLAHRVNRKALWDPSRNNP
jgi:methylated-DNA-[protein]-cysteine S-methyltransferase